MQVHIERNGERHGPYSIEDINAYLANGTLLPTDLAWQDGMTDWLPVSQISGVVMSGGSVATPIPPSQPVSNGNKKKILIGIGAGMGLLALGVGIWFFFIREPGENDVHPTKPAKGLTLEEKVAGTYEQRSFRVGGVTLRFSLASDGTGKTYLTEAQPLGELRWVVEGGEILIEGAKEDGIYRIESTGNLTLVAVKIDGKRKTKLLRDPPLC